MRKALALFLVLGSVTVIGTSYMMCFLISQRDEVEITERVLQGNQSVVEGVTIEQNIKYQDYMRWNTTYIVGEEEKKHTKYQFSAAGTLGKQDKIEESDFTVELNTMVIDGFEETDDAETLTGVTKAMKELFDETEPGKENSAVINLADYMEYYEYELYMNFPENIHYYNLKRTELEQAILRYGSNESYQAELKEKMYLLEKMTEFFKIPVIENHLYEISVSKDKNGKLYGWSFACANGGGSSGNVSMKATLTNADMFSLEMLEAVVNNQCYFTFSNRTYEGNIVDTSQMEGGYGIYCFPFDTKNGTVQIDEMRLVYPLDTEVEVQSLYYDEYRNQLLLFSAEQNDFVLTVIDIDTMEQKQKFVYDKDAYSWQVSINETFLVLFCDESLKVFSVNEMGEYTYEFNCDLSLLNERTDRMPYQDFDEMSFDWNGETFLVSGSLETVWSHYYYRACGFYLAAYDKTGLIYEGVYENSFDNGRNMEDGSVQYNKACHPTDYQPLKVSW